MNTLSITGPEAEVMWAYYRAASLASWSIASVPGQDTLSLTARVVGMDDFKVSQQPLMFVVPRPTGQPWRWPITTLQIVDGMLTASLAPQE